MMADVENPDSRSGIVFQCIREQSLLGGIEETGFLRRHSNDCSD
jgi:hypothetical protein